MAAGRPGAQRLVLGIRGLETHRLKRGAIGEVRGEGPRKRTAIGLSLDQRHPGYHLPRLPHIMLPLMGRQPSSGPLAPAGSAADRGLSISDRTSQDPGVLIDAIEQGGFTLSQVMHPDELQTGDRRASSLLMLSVHRIIELPRAS